MYKTNILVLINCILTATALCSKRGSLLPGYALQGGNYACWAQNGCQDICGLFPCNAAKSRCGDRNYGPSKQQKCQDDRDVCKQNCTNRYNNDLAPHTATYQTCVNDAETKRTNRYNSTTGNGCSRPSLTAAQKTACETTTDIIRNAEVDSCDQDYDIEKNNLKPGFDQCNSTCDSQYNTCIA